MFKSFPEALNISIAAGNRLTIQPAQTIHFGVALAGKSVAISFLLVMRQLRARICIVLWKTRS
jgi:hypothetical protein